MGQYYLIVNVSKSQKMDPHEMGLMSAKATAIVGEPYHEFFMVMFLLDLGDSDYRLSKSLENLCLKFLCDNEQLYPPTTIELLPKQLQRKLETISLSQWLIGEWSGDRLIITGDYSEHSPFPPNGEWKAGNLFGMMRTTGSDSHWRRLQQLHSEDKVDFLKNRLSKFCEGKIHFVVNLDKKEYLDPRMYGNGQNVMDFAFSEHSPMCVVEGLMASLVHSTGCGSGDLPESCASQGMWAGDRITICTAEQVQDFESYKDVSNACDLDY